MAPRDHYRYELRDRRKKVYIGITKDPERRMAEHLNEGKSFSKMVLVGPRVTENSARDWEQSSLDSFRRGHGGRNPRHNKT